MFRLSRRLERRNKLRLWDYYSMGKLIHYTVDAFTFAHNEYFPYPLQAHREYENRLQSYFLQYLKQSVHPTVPACGSVMDTIRSYHSQYSQKPADIHRDSRYSVLVTSLIVCMLLP